MKSLASGKEYQTGPSFINTSSEPHLGFLLTFSKKIRELQIYTEKHFLDFIAFYMFLIFQRKKAITRIFIQKGLTSCYL